MKTKVGEFIAFFTNPRVLEVCNSVVNENLVTYFVIYINAQRAGTVLGFVRVYTFHADFNRPFGL